MTTSARPTMTAERWRAVDQILQGALICTRDHRDEFVAHSCGDDTALRNEVSSLLAAYDTTSPEFLERPAIEEHGFSSGTVPAEPPVPAASRAQPTRMVSARLVLYAAIAGIAAGTVTGWTLAHSSTVERWQGTLKALRLQANANGSSDANSASRTGATGASGELSLVVVNRGGQVVREITANRPWTPRFSPDGRKIAYGAFAEGRGTSDIWITDLDGSAIQRLTDDDADSNDPQWSPDGGTVAYSVSAQGGKDVAEQSAAGGGAHIVASRPGTQFPTDWLHDGSALLVSEDAGDNHLTILVQPADGSAARPYAATRAQESAGRMSPHTHWVAYTSNESGRDEVYVDSYPRPGTPIMISRGGGVDPVWRSDGQELYYWRGDALVAVPIDGSRVDRPPVLGAERELFHLAYERALNSMYDVSPNGERIVIVRRRP
jgi:Tol biopolymer transport system component